MLSSTISVQLRRSYNNVLVQFSRMHLIKAASPFYLIKDKGVIYPNTSVAYFVTPLRKMRDFVSFPRKSLSQIVSGCSEESTKIKSISSMTERPIIVF